MLGGLCLYMGTLNMTVVEYFDNTSIENIATALFVNVDKIIYVGADNNEINTAINRYKEILKDKKIKFEACIEDSHNLKNIVEALEKIVAENDEVVFDLEGGKEIFLLAAGIVYSNHKDKVSLRIIDINKNELINIENNEVISNAPHTYITVDENVKIYGGDILERKDRTMFFSSEWDYTNDLINDIFALWKVYEKHLEDWTELIKELKRLQARCKSGCLSFNADKNSVKESILYSNDILSDLSDCGMILSLKNNKKTLSFTYKNKNVKDLLNEEGNFLETYVTVCAKNCRDKSGRKIFGDVRTGVVIAWDENTKRKIPCVTNEVDVIAMKNLTPVFISCKSGTVKSEELYKLNSVALEFGNKYVKKLLVVASLKFMGDNTYKDFKQRAEELDITVIEVDEIDSLQSALSRI